MKSKIFFAVHFCLLFGWKTYGMKNEIIKISSVVYNFNKIRCQFFDNGKLEHFFIDKKNMQRISDYKNCCVASNVVIEKIYFKRLEEESQSNYYFDFNSSSGTSNLIQEKLDNYFFCQQQEDNDNQNDNFPITNIIITSLDIKTNDNTINSQLTESSSIFGLSLYYAVYLNWIEGQLECSEWFDNGELLLVSENNKLFFELYYKDKKNKEKHIKLLFYGTLAQSIFAAKEKALPFYICINENKSGQKKYCVKISSVNGYEIESECNRKGLGTVEQINQVDKNELENDYFFNIKCKKTTWYGMLVAESDASHMSDIFADTDTQSIINALKQSSNGIIDVCVKSYKGEDELYYVRRSKYTDQLLLNSNEIINIPISEITFKKDNTSITKLNEILIKRSLGLFNNIYNNGKILIFSVIGFTSLCAGMFLLYKNGVLDNIDFFKHVYNSLSMLQY